MGKKNNNQENNNQENNNQENTEKENSGENTLDIDKIPDLTLDILCATRQIVRIAIDRKCFNKEEMDVIEKVVLSFNMSVDKMIFQFQKKNPQIIDQIEKEYNERQEKIKEQKLNSIPEETPLPENIKNGCDAGDEDIQG